MITYYFHISGNSRDKYNFEENLYSLKGSLVIANPRAARNISEIINEVRRSEGRFDEQVTAGQINALGLLHEIFHLILRKYEEGENPGAFSKTIEHLKEQLNEDDLNSTLLKFVEEFPPLPVYQKKILPGEYLAGKSEGKANKEIVLEELIILHLENLNPAARNLQELYSDENLKKETRYSEIIEHTEKYFESEKKLGGLNLFSFLKKPLTHSPYNLEEQLDFIRENWSNYIDADVLSKLLSGKDLIREDFKLFVQHGGGEKGTPPVPQYEFDKEYFESLKAKMAAGAKLNEEEYQYYQLEVQRFTEDIDWMPKVVMIAKNAFVWLYQLSKKYGREIKRLDEIPDEELNQLARWNFTALWLIGLWERSSASKKIKQIMGNIEATSSAYSLYDYVISEELGGEPAFENFKNRALQRGIKLSSDMVPNHTGIYSKWVIEKPGYFIQSEYPPYPNYRFTGPNLSDDPRVEVRVEDQYYSRSDAAVVFERLDKYTGDRTYIYHGNDGTNMPWNDTAQLDLLKEEVRESLIQTIMHVARKTPIIRFDAAMTLAKKHYQRLWFPIPGSGGAIPSRSDYAMTRSQFDSAMPEEFWREVVDRINSQLPNTLLLAEAFWLMEGYFVRTLGMHRVYNSAFMHMFMKEENEKYKLLIKNTLSFNPEILKRYVNFMSNPDEETAINQFGKGDKYFGVATMLVTLPGLPMFAHGQIEGYSEKYGMEYKRSYYEEFVDENLVLRHQKEIFPLLKKRYLFSQVQYFELYDFLDIKGNVNENVFAFTNRNGNEISLVLYNNSYAEAIGKINYSAEKSWEENGKVHTTKIDKALGFNSSDNFYYIFTDHTSQQEFIITGKEVAANGFGFHLWGYQNKVLINFREVYDFDGSYRRILEYLNGRGVHSINDAIRESNLQPFHNSIVHFFSSKGYSKISQYIFNKEETSSPDLAIDLKRLVEDYSKATKEKIETDDLIESLNNEIEAIKSFELTRAEISESKKVSKWFLEANDLFEDNTRDGKTTSSDYLILMRTFNLLLLSLTKNRDEEKVFDNLMLWKPLFEIFGFLNIGNDAGDKYELLKTISEIKGFPVKSENKKEKSIKVKSKKDVGVESENDNALQNYLKYIFDNKSSSSFLKVNEYKSEKYFNKERFNELFKWLFINSALSEFIKRAKDIGKADAKAFKVILNDLLNSLFNSYNYFTDNLEESEYKVEKLFSIKKMILSKSKSSAKRKAKDEKK